MATKLLINNHLRRLTAAPPSISSYTLSTTRRKLHESAYEKEVEEDADVNVEVEEMSHQAEEEYWEPDPDTGVFVPASEQNSEEPAVSCTTEETVLDEKAFFRPHEDLATKLLINNHLRRVTAAHPSICSSAVSTTRRKLHESAYEKEVEEEADVNVSVKEVSHQAEEEYWEPDPDTGVFVPASEQNSEEPAVSCTTEETVLDEKAFFRPQEDLEPPPTESFTGEIPPVDPFAE